MAISLHCTIFSLEATYEALKTFEVLGIEKKLGIKTSSCASVADTIRSTSSALKDIFHALSVNSILKCELNSKAFRVLKTFFPLASLCKILFLFDLKRCSHLDVLGLQGTESRLKGSLDNANSLIDFYYSIRGLVLLKVNIPLIKSCNGLSQSSLPPGLIKVDLYGGKQL